MIGLAFVLMAATAQPATPRPHPEPQKCCVPRVYDAAGKEIGEIIRYDDRFPSIPLDAWVRYEVKGDSVAIVVSAEGFRPSTSGGSAVVFTSNDCSGDAFLNQITPTLTKRYGVVLTEGGASGWIFQNTHAWLYATDPLPMRVSPGGTTFHSQWDSTNTCTQYPAPGLTFPPNQFGFWAKRIEDLYLKFKRPFFVP